MLIEIITGEETFRQSGTCEIKAFYRARHDSREVMAFEAVKRPDSGLTQIGSPTFIPASDRNDNHGKWVIARYNAPDGSLFHLKFGKRRTGEWKYDRANIFVRVREGAALMAIEMLFTGSQFASLSSGTIQGNFDIIRPEWYEVLGLQEYIEEYDEDYVTLLLDTRVLEPAKSSWSPAQRVAVETNTGKVLRVVKPLTKRNIRLGKK